MSHPTAGSPLPLIDGLKAVACQAIVLHHLAFYGPMSDATMALAPDLVRWFSADARMAVQVFLVVAGFLAARSLAPDGVLLATPPARLLWQRYLRLALPFAAALAVAIGCSALAERWMDHDSIPPPPGAWQLVAHALLLHSLLDVESLTAGAWYVAIDLQLFALLLGLLWLARAARLSARALVAAVAVASLWHFNRDSDWDVWALYFFGAYGLGAMAWWCTRPAAGPAGRRWLVALALLAVGALAIDFRERIALALTTALLLAASVHTPVLHAWARHAAVAYAARISYAVFLLNFPIALVVNAAFARFAPADPWVQTGGVLLAWLACNVAGALFYRAVEQPLDRWMRAPRLSGPAPRPAR